MSHTVATARPVVAIRPALASTLKQRCTPEPPVDTGGFTLLNMLVSLMGPAEMALGGTSCGRVAVAGSGRPRQHGAHSWVRPAGVSPRCRVLTGLPVQTVFFGRSSSGLYSTQARLLSDQDSGSGPGQHVDSPLSRISQAWPMVPQQAATATLS